MKNYKLNYERFIVFGVPYFSKLIYKDTFLISGPYGFVQTIIRLVWQLVILFSRFFFILFVLNFNFFFCVFKGSVLAVKGRFKSSVLSSTIYNLLWMWNKLYTLMHLSWFKSMHLALIEYVCFLEFLLIFNFKVLENLSLIPFNPRKLRNISRSTKNWNTANRDKSAYPVLNHNASIEFFWWTKWTLISVNMISFIIKVMLGLKDFSRILQLCPFIHIRTSVMIFKFFLKIDILFFSFFCDIVVNFFRCNHNFLYTGIKYSAFVRSGFLLAYENKYRLKFFKAGLGGWWFFKDLRFGFHYTDLRLLNLSCFNSFVFLDLIDLNHHLLSPTVADLTSIRVKRLYGVESWFHTLFYILYLWNSANVSQLSSAADLNFVIGERLQAKFIKPDLNDAQFSIKKKFHLTLLIFYKVAVLLRRWNYTIPNMAMTYHLALPGGSYFFWSRLYTTSQILPYTEVSGKVNQVYSILVNSARGGFFLCNVKSSAIKNLISLV